MGSRNIPHTTQQKSKPESVFLDVYVLTHLIIFNVLWLVIVIVIHRLVQKFHFFINGLCKPQLQENFKILFI